MALLIDWTRGESRVTRDVYARLVRDTGVNYRAYLVEEGAPMVPASIAPSRDAAGRASLTAAEAMSSSRASAGAAIASEDGMVSSETGLAALAFYAQADDRANGVDPIGGTRVDLPAGPLLDAVFTRMEAGDHDGAVAAIYAAAKARMAEDPLLAAEFGNLRDA